MSKFNDFVKCKIMFLAWMVTEKKMFLRLVSILLYATLWYIKNEKMIFSVWTRSYSNLKYIFKSSIYNLKRPEVCNLKYGHTSKNIFLLRYYNANWLPSFVRENIKKPQANRIILKLWHKSHFLQPRAVR